MTMTPANEIVLSTNGTPGIALQFAKSPLLEDHMASEVGRLLDDVRWALNCDLSAAKASAAHLAAFLASKLSLDVHTTPARGGLAPWQKRKLQNHIENGLEGSLPVEDLANLVSLSPSHFCRVFKESFGESPHGYITKLRVERARTLMLTTSESLSQIALACGLADQAHLCRCFRRVTGTTPGFWRRSRATGPRTVNGETTAGRCIEYA
jgi:AraC family transcriptional regulator